MLSPEQFTTADPVALYERMRPDQRTAIANEFLRNLTLAGDPQAERFGKEAADTGDVAPARAEHDSAEEGARLGTPGSVPPIMDSVQQVAAIHTYTRDHHPDLFARVREHPVTVSSLMAPGAPPLHVETEDELMPEAPPVEVNPHTEEINTNRSGLAAMALDDERDIEQRSNPIEGGVDPAGFSGKPGDSDADRFLRRNQAERP